ncbi:MAG: AsmA-like C-terminal domain-containing protein [Phycisphaerales bacterium]|nr:MAG: AsmA-like C-terminal domain-containing protein [Phycisphaerales bacterium]
MWVFYIAAGRALCYIAMRQIAGLTNTKIRTESVAFHSNGSVYIKNLTISPHQEQADSETILSAENVYARFRLSSLLSLRPSLKVIDVNDFVFNARYNLDAARWNLSALKFRPLRQDPRGMPAIHLGRGTLQYSKISRGREKVALRVPLNARFGLDDETQKGYSFEITTATMASGFGRSRLAGHWKPGAVTITGGISSADVPELEMAWMIDVLAAELTYDQNDAFSLKLNIKDLQSRRSPELKRLPLVGPAFLERSGSFAALQKFFEYYQPRGQIDIELEASGDLNRIAESTLAGTVYCKDVALCHRQFQYPIEHLTGRVDFTDRSVRLNNLSGRHEDVELFFNGRSSDFGPHWKYDIRITSDHMPLDTDLYNAMSTKQQEFWRVFSPTGSAAIDYRLTRTSQTDKHKKLLVELRGMDAMYQHFPYPLKNLTGQLSFESDKVLFLDVVSEADERKITVNGETAIHGAGKSIYDISVQVNNLPLDSTLEAALPEKQKNLYRQLDPNGLVDGWVKVSAENAASSSFTADLSFREASLNSDQLPFPISEVTARALFTPDSIIVKDFSGRYDDGLVSLTGQVWPDTEDGQVMYDLALKLQQARLNGELFSLLPESPGRIISDLEPEGRVNLTADLNKQNLAEPPDYSIALECLGNSVILPKLCYLLKDVRGGLTIEPDRITFVDVNAVVHEDAPASQTQATVILSGELALTDEGFGSGTLDLLVSDVPFDEQFAQALPQHLQSVYNKLAPNGRFDLDFENIRVSGTNDGQKSVDFAGAVTLKNCGFAVSGSRIAAGAELKTEGRYKTGQGLMSCQTILDDGTLKIRGKSFTSLKANIVYEPNAHEWTAEDLTADWYGGKLKGKLVLRQPASQAAEYVLQTGFDSVDLQRFLADTESDLPRENGHTSGKMNGSFGINARIGDNTSRIGACKLIIRDMEVGKLSPLAKLLNVLKLTEPTDYAFDQMFVDSYVRHNSLFVKKLDLSGRSVAFYGSGQMDLQTQNVDLTLTARGQRLATDDPSILQSLTEGLGQAVVRMNVTGSFHDPKVTTQTLPVIGGTLQVLGAKPADSN